MIAVMYEVRTPEYPIVGILFSYRLKLISDEINFEFVRQGVLASSSLLCISKHHR